MSLNPETQKYVSRMSLYLGLDVGTQSTKAIIIDSRQDYTIVGRGSHPHFLITSPDRPNQAEQHPSQWTDAILSSVKQAITGLDPSQIAAIAVSGQQHGLVPLDSNRNIIRPSKLWCDTESSNEAHHLSSLFQDPSLVASFTITKIAWLKNHEPDSYTKLINGGLVLLPHDYINYWLTGVECMEPSDASGTGVFDPVTRTWATDRITAIDPKLLAVLPPIIPSSLPPQRQSIGTLLPSIAELLGLPPGIPVGQGGGDNAMTALGVGAVHPGRQVIISLGTSGTLFGPSATPVIDPLGVICPFCDAAGIGGLPLLCTLNCASAAEEVRIGFGMTREEITQLATAGSTTGIRANSDKDRKQKECLPSPGCHGITFLPYFVGERSPNWPHASGAIVGLRPGLMTPGLLYRAALEGATFSLVAGLDRLREMTRNNDDTITTATTTASHHKELLLVGGGSRSALWRRIICDAFQLPLKFPVEPDSAALGAAYQAAAVGKGVPVAAFIENHARPAMEGEVMQPDESVAAEYREAYERFKKWGGEMFGGRTADL